MNVDRTLSHLKILINREEWTRDRVGDPGCRVRLDAQDNIDALQAAYDYILAAETKAPA